MQSRTRRLAAIVLGLYAGVTGAADRDNVDGLRSTTLNLIRLMVEQGVITQDKADELVRAAEKPPAPTAPATPEAADAKAGADVPPGVVRVPYVPEMVKKEMREQIKQEVLLQAKAERWGEPGALPDWLERIRFEGDIRLRYEQDRFDSSNPPPQNFQAGGQNITNTTENRDRLQFRARFGVEAHITERIDAGLRLTTDSARNPASVTTTEGNYMGRYDFKLDRAFLSYTDGETLKVFGGRFPNPWVSTDLVWSENLNFDGVAVQYRDYFGENRKGWAAFATAGVFPLQDIEPSNVNASRSKWMYGAQGGAQWTDQDDSWYRVALALYDFRKVEGVPNPVLSSIANSASAAPFTQKGNTLFDVNSVSNPGTPLYGLASKFREVNLTFQADIAAYDPIHILLTGDYVKNIGFKRGEIRNRTGLDLEPKTTGWFLRAGFGAPQVRKQGDWQAFVGYKYLERDAVVDAFNDSDFHLGGTDAKGYILGGSYGLAKDTWFTVRWMSANSASGLPTSLPLAIDVLQVDLNARF